MAWRAREITDEDEMLLSEMVAEGADFLSIRSRLPDVRLHELRSLYTTYARAIRTGRLRPVPEDMAERIKWVQSQWSQREWGVRWVGRYAQRQATDLQRLASQLLPR